MAGGVGGWAASETLATGELDDMGCVEVAFAPDGLGGEIGG